MTKINFRVDSSENFKSANTELSKGEPTLSSSFPYELKVSSSDDSTWDQAITINPVTEYTPTNINEVFSAGLITFDNNFLYIKTSAGWKQIALVDLGSVVNPPQPPTGPTTTTTTTTADPSATTTTTTADPSSTTTTTTTTADPSSTTTTTTTTSTTTSTTTTTTLPPASFSTSIFTFGLDEDNIKDDTTSYTNRHDQLFRNYGYHYLIDRDENAEEIEVDGVTKLEWTFPGYISFWILNKSPTNDPMNVAISLKQGNTLISTATSTVPATDRRAFKVKTPLYVRPDFDSSHYTSKSYWNDIPFNQSPQEWQFVNGKLHTPLIANEGTVRNVMQGIIEDPFTEVSNVVEQRTDQEGVFLFADNPDVTLEITTNQYYRIFFADYEYASTTFGTTLFSKTVSDWGNMETFPQYIMKPDDIQPVSIRGFKDQDDRTFGSAKTRLKSLPSSIPSHFRNLAGCFSGTSSRLTSSVTSWDTSNINNMDQLCYDSEFNQDISSWNTANVQSFQLAFSSPVTFTSSVANRLFFYETIFNRPIGAWDTSSAENVIQMFYNNTSFNQIISNWDTSKVKFMTQMFARTVFNQDISSWDTSAVQTMSNMFMDNSVFNQPIGIWDTSSLTEMSYMFMNASAFDQVLSNWTLNNVVSALYFAQNSAFTQTNFKDTVIAFDNNTSQAADIPKHINFSPVLGPSTDNAYLTAFFSLESKNFFIKDGDN